MLAESSRYDYLPASEDRASHSTAAGEEGTEGTPALFKAITE
jgi:hypothetical protein